jgi:type II secretory pathway component PulF
MPLIKSSSKKAFTSNVSEMVKAGYPVKQALAAAYSTKRKSKTYRSHKSVSYHNGNITMKQERAK